VLGVKGWCSSDDRVGRCVDSVQMWSLQVNRRGVGDMSRGGNLQVGFQYRCRGDGKFFSCSSVNLATGFGTRLNVSSPCPFLPLDLSKVFLPLPGSGNAERHAEHAEVQLLWVLPLAMSTVFRGRITWWNATRWSLVSVGVFGALSRVVSVRTELLAGYKFRF